MIFRCRPAAYRVRCHSAFIRRPPVISATRRRRAAAASSSVLTELPADSQKARDETVSHCAAPASRGRWRAVTPPPRHAQAPGDLQGGPWRPPGANARGGGGSGGGALRGRGFRGDTGVLPRAGGLHTRSAGDTVLPDAAAARDRCHAGFRNV